jgi:hypothetical protein
VKTTRTVLMLCLVAACSDSDSDSARCGEGTMEENGTCVPAADDDDDASTGSPATTAATRAVDDDGNDDSDGETSFGDSSGGAPSTYASCFAGSDVECTHNEQCIESLDTCASLCGFDTDCPAPPGGTAVQRCEALDGYWSEICVLYCGVEGATCPLGMVCRETTLCEGDDGGSSSGGWGTTGCGASILPICVWE